MVCGVRISESGGLYRQVQERHKLGTVAMGGDEIAIHVPRMRCRVANPPQAVDLVQPMDQFRQVSLDAVRVTSVIGIHVLTKQHDLARAVGDTLPGFLNDLIDRPGEFGTARVGDDAECAELVASLLYGNERRDR